MTSVRRIMLRVGRYYASSQFFYHRLLRNEFQRIGFRVIYVERDEMGCWLVRLYGTATAINYLLITCKIPNRRRKEGRDLLELHLQYEALRIVRDLGAPIQRDRVLVDREGAYFSVVL